MEGSLGIVYLTVVCFSTSLKPCSADAIERKVTTKSLQPDSPPENRTLPNLFHTTADGPHDTLHYIVGTYGAPSIFVARTDLHTHLEVNWDHFLSSNLTNVAHSIKFSREPYYVYGVQLLQLIEYDDPDDHADLTKANPNRTHKYDLSVNIPWANSTLFSDLKKNQIILKVKENYTDSRTGDQIVFMPGGSFSLKVQINDQLLRGVDLPHLQHTANTTQIDVILDHILPSYGKTRYALEILYVTQEDEARKNSIQLHTHTSIDDEHTPGVFQITDISTNMTPTSFIQWKPVCYKSTQRAMKTGTKVKHYTPVSESNGSSVIQNKKSILYAYFGDDLYSDDLYSVAVFNVSFGLSLDKFYSNTYYTAWSFIIGYGEATPEVVSLLVIIIISLGLGIPVLFIMFGSLGACIHKKKYESASGYRPIN